jgi:hypothetical protein
MGRMILRAIVPILLLAGGVASLRYGAELHRVPVEEAVVKRVLEKQEMEIPYEPDEIFPPVPFVEQPPPPFRPPPRYVTVLVPKDVTEDVIQQESEPVLVLGATTGRLPLLAAGQLRRPQGQAASVQSPSKKGLALCPT